jgi:hypothetical protein
MTSNHKPSSHRESTDRLARHPTIPDRFLSCTSPSRLQRPLPAIVLIYQQSYPALQGSVRIGVSILQATEVNGMQCTARLGSLLLSLVDGSLNLVDGRLAFRDTRDSLGKTLKQRQTAVRRRIPSKSWYSYQFGEHACVKRSLLFSTWVKLLSNQSVRYSATFITVRSNLIMLLQTSPMAFKFGCT